MENIPDWSRDRGVFMCNLKQKSVAYPDNKDLFIVFTTKEH